MGFIKRTRIAESVNFEIRAEFFNVFNRTNFGLGGTPPRPNVPTEPASAWRTVPAWARDRDRSSPR